MPTTLNLIGDRYGRLTVVAKAQSHEYTRWECKCDCGGAIVATSKALRQGYRISCGCAKAGPRRKSSASAAAKPTADAPPTWRHEALTVALGYPT